jgi:hypothetical protein
VVREHPEAESPFGSCRYEVDDDWRIVRVDEAWAAFARANDAPELLPPHPIGTHVLACIADRTTTALYESLFAKVRRTRFPLSLPFRCDSPTRRRFLDLLIEPRSLGGLRLRSRLLRTEPREAVPLLDRRRPRNGRLLRMCSFCKRVEAHERWCEVEDAVTALRLFDCDSLPTLSHVTCPDCYRRAAALSDS